MQRRQPIALLAALPALSAAILLAGCQGAEPAAEPLPVADTTEANLSAIRALHGSFMEAYNKSDIDALAALFTADAIRMPPFGPAFVGDAAIRADFGEIFHDSVGMISITVDEARLSGDFAVARGTWAVTLTPKDGGEPTSDVGKWLNLLERQADGSWKISRNIWNSDQPAA